MIRSRFGIIASFLALIVAFSVQPVFGQSDELKRPATIVFDVDVSALMASLKKMGVDVKMFKDVPLDGPFQDATLGDVQRVSGAVGLPTELDAFMRPGIDAPPVDAYVRMKFSSPEIAEGVLEGLKRSGGEAEINGVTYVVEDERNPENMLAHLSDMSEVEIGTGAYILRKNRDVMTGKLAAKWKSLPKNPVRFAIDMESNAALIKEATGFANDMAPPMAAPFIQLVNNMKSIDGMVNLDKDDMLVINFACVDDAKATELKDGLEGIFALAKMGSATAMQDIKREAPKAAKPVKEMLDSLKATADGSKVMVKIKKPEGFGPAISEMVNTAQRQAKMVTRMNDFRQLALGALNYESAYRKFPFSKGASDLSWRAKILMFLEQNEMSDQMDLDKGPSADANKQFANSMPVLYGKDKKMSNAVWIVSDVTGFGNITDGSSNTIMLMEYPPGRPWLENKDVSQAEAVKLVTGLKQDEYLIAVFYDGSTIKLTNKMSKETLENLFNPKDRKIIDRSELSR